MASHGIEIRNLYKIFGPNGRAHIDAVKNGISKSELNEKHGHVLGLEGYQHFHARRRDHRCHGAFRLRQIDADPPYQPADRPDIR